MEIYDYTPKTAGRAVNIAAAGGVVSRFAVFSTAARTGVALVDVGPATPNGDGSWRFTFDAPADPNRYYQLVEWTAATGGPTMTDRIGYLDLPTRYDLVVSADDVASKLGLTAITSTQRERIEEEIVARQTDAANYINRDIFGVLDTATGMLPRYGFPMSDWRAWPALLDRYDDRVTVLAYRVGADGGSYDVDVLVGLDGRNEPALTRFVMQSAVEGLRNDGSSGLGKRLVTSVSAEGQSVTYDKLTAKSTDSGGQPDLDSLASLKRMSVFRTRASSNAEFPYSVTAAGIFR